MEKMTDEQRQRAERILHYHEEKALGASTLNPGAGDTLDELRRRGLPIGILTRNRKRNAEAIAAKHGLRFDAIVGREDGPVKPDAFGVLHLCRQFNVDPAQAMLIGDYLFDLRCARAAGATAVLIANHPEANKFLAEADYAIERLDEILPIIDEKDQGDKALS
jgi:HAD superfamily hydrolase (TIGR01549 family)